jgi:hypothetical protein
MTQVTQLTTHELTIDGRQMAVTINRLAPTTLRISWQLPVNPEAYAGAAVLLSEEMFSSANFPIDGTRYTASTNWSAPADTIDHGRIVAAFYKFFGDDVNQTYVDVTGVDPNKMYYASIYAASSVLQYYVPGVQSYPLESSRFEKKSETFAGSIPSATVAPQNPYNGQVYFDTSVNAVFIWNDQMSTWVQSNQKTVPLGQIVPVSKKQLFFNNIDAKLRFFDGTAWVDCTAANTRVKMGAAWAPFSTSTVTATLPQPAVAGDFIYITNKAATSAPPTIDVKFFSLGMWFNPSPETVQVFVDGSWSPIAPSTQSWGQREPQVPTIGDFFYQTTTRDLLVWAGSEWVKADTENEGTPSTDKIGIGTDGSYDERLRLIKILKHQLGYPSICAELSEEQFNVAIDNALDEFRRRADNAYNMRHVSFSLKKGQSMYYLNDPRNKTDRIVNVIKIHRINQLGVSSLSSDSGLYAQTFFNQLYQGSNVDVLSIHLMSQLSETYDRIFAGNLAFHWDEASRQLTVLRRINTEEERVVLEVVMEKTEQELLLDRWSKQWIQSWSQSECWEMLGEIRSKYGSLPGPAGGISLNGAELLQRSTDLQAELLRQITDYEVGNGGLGFGNCSFLIG